jgi:membrane-bound lytic murein transglycosylase A
LLATLAIGACEKAPPVKMAALILEESRFAELPGWSEDRVAEALPALLRSCARLEGRPVERPVGPAKAGGAGGKVGDWRPACRALAATQTDDAAAVRGALEAWFVPFRLSRGDDTSGLVTGYYEAELEAALFPGGPYQAPVYGRPADLVTVNLGSFRADLAGRRLVGRVEDGRLVPYYERREIEGGVLANQDMELLWASDPVDVFILHIQGSGRVRFPDGTLGRIGFAASNGHSFYAIGRALIEEKKLPRDKASMQHIRAWLKANPEEAERIMGRNPRYIFFRPIDGDGPVGAQGVALTAGRSLAVDPAFLPLGAPIFLDTTWPGETRPLRRLMVAQDTGSAIKGPLRGDFYWGTGEAALAYAGGMKQRAVFYLLLPKSLAERRRLTS